MDRLDAVDDKRFIFGSLFIVANKLDTLLDRALSAYGMTSKQWLLTVTIETFFDEPPTIKQVAAVMGSSHQNVKQVALKLANKGLISMEKDPKDARATRLKITDESRAFWENTQQKGVEFVESVFKGMDPMELSIARNALMKISENLFALDHDDNTTGGIR